VLDKKQDDGGKERSRDDAARSKVALSNLFPHDAKKIDRGDGRGCAEKGFPAV